MFLFLGASSCASAASWVISSVCLQIDKREGFFGDPRNSGELAFSMEKMDKNDKNHPKTDENIWKSFPKCPFLVIVSIVHSCSFSCSLLSAHQTGTPLHPSSPITGCQLCVFSSNRARLEVGCAASNAAYPPVIIKLTYLGICFSIYVTAFHAFRFMRAVSKRWRTCLSPSRTRRALRRRSNSVYQGKSSLFKQRYS